VKTSRLAFFVVILLALGFLNSPSMEIWAEPASRQAAPQAAPLATPQAIPTDAATEGTKVTEGGSAPLSRRDDAIQEISALRRAYPDVRFAVEWDAQAIDWKLRLSHDGASSDLYYADGKYLSPAELGSRDNFRPLLYPYPKDALDPAKFTAAQTARIRTFGSSESRKSAPITSSAFFDALYDCGSLKAIQPHVVTIRFLGQSLDVHERIVPQLRRVDKKIRAAAETDQETARFLRNLGSVDGFYWRQIRDTAGRSFHSMGIAIDLLPKHYRNYIIYWNWEKESKGANWMLTPLSQRWTPGAAVIAAFESEGFIWGGKWAVWDNMHFEYRPELLEGRALPNLKSETWPVGEKDAAAGAGAPSPTPAE
jgi:hypothetical protein